jgi:hypothetical protein
VGVHSYYISHLSQQVDGADAVACQVESTMADDLMDRRMIRSKQPYQLYEIMTCIPVGIETQRRELRLDIIGMRSTCN